MRLLAILLRRPRRVIAVWGGIAVLTLPGLAGLGHDNSPEVFFVRDAEALARYRDFADTFDEHGALRIVVRGPGIWSREGLDWLRTLEFEAARQRGVVGAAGLWGFFRSSWRPWPPADPAAFREAVLAAPLAAKAGWVSAGGSAVSVLLALDDLDPAGRSDLLDGLESLLARPPARMRASVTGLATVNRALDDALRGIVLEFFPIVVVLLVGLLLAATRSLVDAAAALLFVGFAQGVLFGVMGYAGASFNVVTSILPPLTFVLSLATAVHLLVELRAVRRRVEEPAAAVVETYRRKTWPVVWTGITTAAAFGSLAISAAPPVRSLGIWSAVGIGCILLVAFTLYPVLLTGAAVQRRPRTGFERFGRRLGGGAADWAIRRRRDVVLLFGAVTLLLLAGLPRLAVETGVLDYFRSSHPVRAAMDAAHADGVGTVTAELVVTAPPGQSFEHGAALAGLTAIAGRLEAEPLVLGTVSPADLLSEGPVEELDAFRRQGLATLLGAGGGQARVSIFLPLVGFSRVAGLFDRAVAVAREELPGGQAWITGRYPMVLAAQRTLLSTMVAALAVTLLSVAVAFRLLLGGTRRTLVALLPNLWPVAAVLGAMGWAGIPIDSGTVMVAAVALGLAVDDTLHFFGALRRRAADAPAAAVRGALERVAPAQLLTSTILALGFGVCALSAFVPVARFGALSALAVATALAADLLLLPALFAGRSGSVRRGASDG